MNIYDAIENVCEKCGQHMSYPYWATNGYTCIKCGYTEKQKTHSDVEEKEKTMLLANLDTEDEVSELRLCPYCNGDARILPEGDYHEVTCEVCGVYVQGHTYEDAVNAWNCNAEIYDNTED